MSEYLANLLDLNSAWQTVVRDNRLKRNFVRHPHERRLIQSNAARWHDSLLADIRADRYAPSPMRIAEVPKSGGHIRPGAWLNLRDQVVYAALVYSMLPKIRPALAWARRIDQAYRFRHVPRAGQWFENRFEGWKSFTDLSLRQIATGTSYVVVADIAGYYESIDISTLVSDLRGLDCDEEAVVLLSQCLNRWSQTLISGRGIPQGFTASDVLGKLYLDSVDQRLDVDGFRHLRYVDDFRIFCADRREARAALVALTRSVRKRGLILQTAKSSYKRADEAQEEIENVQNRIRTVVREFLADVAERFEVEDPYFNVREADELLSESPEEIPVDLMFRAFTTYFAEGNSAEFDKTLFHFVLRRLGTAGDGRAADYCIGLIRHQPQEVDRILDYIADIGEAERREPQIIEELNQLEGVYWHPIYLFLEWVLEMPHPPSNDLIVFARRLAYNSNAAPYVKTMAKEVLAAVGEPADLERFEQEFADAESDLQQAAMVCFVRRVERQRRNSFLGRIGQAGELTEFAIRWVRTIE